MQINPDKKIAEGIENGLKRNEEKYGKRYCPCRRVTGDKTKDAKIICPCIYREQEVEKDGKCLCGLFVK